MCYLFLELTLKVFASQKSCIIVPDVVEIMTHTLLFQNGYLELKL